MDWIKQACAAAFQIRTRAKQFNKRIQGEDPHGNLGTTMTKVNVSLCTKKYILDCLTSEVLEMLILSTYPRCFMCNILSCRCWNLCDK